MKEVALELTAVGLFTSTMEGPQLLDSSLPILIKYNSKHVLCCCAYFTESLPVIFFVGIQGQQGSLETSGPSGFP